MHLITKKARLQGRGTMGTVLFVPSVSIVPPVPIIPKMHHYLLEDMAEEQVHEMIGRTELRIVDCGNR